MPMGLIAAISKQSETVVKPIFTITRPIVLPPQRGEGNWQNRDKQRNPLRQNSKFKDESNKEIYRELY